MCGILGSIPATNEHDFAKSLHTLAHRGPDDFGIYIDEDISLGHRRLSIVDLSHNASQPMHYQVPESVGGGRYSIVFNGEVYNFIELRKELEKLGHRFRTHSDTEVVVASFSQWGEKCLNRFNGMWALGIWDHKRKRLFLARDRFGKKPLFYAFVKNEYGVQFVFASEMKAIYPYLKELKPAKDFVGMVSIYNIFAYENGGGTYQWDRALSSLAFCIL
ncbi:MULTISPECIES: asparagine synthetase B [unclassified Helicobacter]|uniref:asparagine synthetase B family protein n=1 Tax=unclassified Helicobacter TaxID=2593540 RepID=UPI000E1E519E|nr:MULTISPECIES: hypothetical protein [unclassified Helicobacter]